MALSHVSRVILVIHDFIVHLLEAIVTDRDVRRALWEEVLVERLCKIYKRAMSVVLAPKNAAVPSLTRFT